MSPQDFGEKLRHVRERRGVSLESIAAATKLNRRLFLGLESGDCSRWPAGLYSRAYVRAYATAIGLDPEELVVEFAESFPMVAWPDGRPGEAPRAEGEPPSPERNIRTGRISVSPTWAQTLGGRN